MPSKDYTTIQGRVDAEITVKGSRFIAVAVPVSDEDSAKAIIEDLKTEFPMANHYTYGMITGGSDRRERSSDNGEPSGTAGRPILHVIRESGLSDIIVVVIRYFGGTLLGTGGLVKTYTDSAVAAISSCRRVERRICGIYALSLPYSAYDGFINRLSGFFAGKPVCEYSADVSVTVAVPVGKEEDFLTAIRDATSGSIQPRLVEHRYA